MSEPQDVNVKVEAPPRLWDPNGPKAPSWVSVITNTTGLGVIVILFAWNFMRQGEQAERVIEKIQAGLDKQEDRRAKEQEREIGRLDKQHEAAVAQMREWNKAVADRSGLEFDKIRLELKAMTEAFKLASDRLRLNMPP